MNVNNLVLPQSDVHYVLVIALVCHKQICAGNHISIQDIFKLKQRRFLLSQIETKRFPKLTCCDLRIAAARIIKVCIQNSFLFAQHFKVDVYYISKEEQI